jgi:hypothetical protein
LKYLPGLAGQQKEGDKNGSGAHCLESLRDDPDILYSIRHSPVAQEANDMGKPLLLAMP